MKGNNSSPKTTTSREKMFQDKYNKILKAINEGDFYPATMEYAESVYHYTNIPAFKSIVDSQSMWATDFRFLNDEEEFIYVCDVLEKALSSLASYKDKGCKRFRDALLERCRNIFYGKSFDSEYISIGTENYYVICFSKSAHNLTLWSEFSQQGCSLEFNWMDIISNINDQNIKSTNGAVVYDEFTQCKIVKEAYENVLEAFFPKCELWEKSKLWQEIEDFSTKEMDFLINACAELIWYRGMFMKRPPYRMEDEFRIVIYCSDIDKKKYVATDQFLKPHIEIPLKLKDFPIKSITLAPKNSEKFIVSSLREFISSTPGLENSKVLVSDIKLRY